MKKFLIFIFTMFGLMLGMLAMIYNEYIRAYEAAHHRSSFPEPKENLLVPVSTRAYAKAKSWSEKSPLSKQQIKNYLTKYGRYSEYTSQSAVNKLNIDWKEEAVKEAESSANGGNISKERLLEILVENRKFTQEEAEYAIEHAQVDWLN